MSRFGALLDSTFDRVSESAVLFGVLIHALRRRQNDLAVLAFITIGSSLLVSYIRARAEGLQAPVTDGMFTRAERVLVLAVGLLLGWPASSPVATRRAYPTYSAAAVGPRQRGTRRTRPERPANTPDAHVQIIAISGPGLVEASPIYRNPRMLYSARMTRAPTVILLALAFAAAGSACGHRFRAGLPSAPSTPTPVGTPASGTVLAADDFSDPSIGLLPRSCTGAPTLAGNAYECGYFNSEYQLAVPQPTTQGIALALVPGSYATRLPASNTTVDVDVRLATIGAGLPSVALRCRRILQSPAAIQGYELTIAPGAGAFTLLRFDPTAGNAGTNAVRLAGPQLSPAIQQGVASNHLRLTCNGSTITATINGMQVASVQDNTYQFGQVELVAEMLPSGPPDSLK